MHTTLLHTDLQVNICTRYSRSMKHNHSLHKQHSHTQTHKSLSQPYQAQKSSTSGRLGSHNIPLNLHKSIVLCPKSHQQNNIMQVFCWFISSYTSIYASVHVIIYSQASLLPFVPNKTTSTHLTITDCKSWTDFSLNTRCNPKL